MISGVAIGKLRFSCSSVASALVNSVDTQSGTFSNILSRIPIQVNAGGIVFATPNNATHKSIVDLRSIDTLTIRLTGPICEFPNGSLGLLGRQKADIGHSALHVVVQAMDVDGMHAMQLFECRSCTVRVPQLYRTVAGERIFCVVAF